MSLEPDEFSVTPEPPIQAPKIPTPIPSFFPDPGLPKQYLGSSRPFILLGNICIHVDRIVSVEFLPNAMLYKVEELVLYREAAAEQEADMRKDYTIEEFNAPVLHVKFINANDMTETVRRWGKEAEEAWEYITNDLVLR